MNIMITGIMVLAAVYLAYCAGIYLLQKNAVYAPGVEIVATPKDLGLEYEDVALVSRDGAEVKGWFVPCCNDRQAVPFLSRKRR